MTFALRGQACAASDKLFDAGLACTVQDNAMQWHLTFSVEVQNGCTFQHMLVDSGRNQVQFAPAGRVVIHDVARRVQCQICTIIIGTVLASRAGETLRSSILRMRCVRFNAFCNDADIGAKTIPHCGFFVSKNIFAESPTGRINHSTWRP